MLKIKPFLLALTSVLFLSLLISCNEDLSSVGNSLLPDSDGITVKSDTITNFKVITKLPEPLTSTSVDQPLIGEIKDNVFGTTNGILVSQFMFDLNQSRYGDTSELVSANLILEFDTIMGNKYANMKFTVFELLPDDIKNGINDDKIYYSNTDYEELYNRKELTSIEFIPKDIEDSVRIDSTMDYMKLVFPLPESYYSKLRRFQDSILITPYFISDTSYNEDSTDFTLKYWSSRVDSAYKRDIGALAIEATCTDLNTSGGAILRFILTNTISSNDYNDETDVLNKSRIEVIYQKESDTTYSLYPYSLDPTDSNYPLYGFKYIKNINIFKHDYSGSIVENHINIPDDTIGFVQSCGGISTVIQLPDLDPYFETYGDNFLINGAVLSCNQLKNNNTFDYLLPQSLYVKDPGVQNTYITDFFVSAYYASGYIYDSIAEFREYKMLIPQIVKSITDKETGNDLIIYPCSFPNGIYDHYYYNSDILDTRSLKLIITYTIP